MTISLYDATIPSCLQILGSVSGLLDKAQAFCAEGGIAEDELLDARLAADMLPFAYQVKSVCVHSFGAIEGVRRGEFNPNSEEPGDFARLRERIGAAVAGLEAVEPGEIEGLIGKPMRFVATKFAFDFTADQFLLSFSQPNFYFHAATAYDILRWKGVAIGKRHFIGAIRKIG